MRIRSLTETTGRRGVILLVVLALLTLFAILGVTFVLYANAAAMSARINRDAVAVIRPEVDPELALDFVLGQILYDVSDDNPGVFSAVRGHSLGRSAFGWNYDGTAAHPNDKPFAGTGRPVITSAYGQRDHHLINYTFFPNDGFLRDPERHGVRTSLNAARGPFTGGFNVPYTYPDYNNVYLAQMRPSTGQIELPSYYRRQFGALNDPNNPNWTIAAGKYLTLRPRPADHYIDPLTSQPAFPMPDDAGGDVKNAEWAPGGNDSIWIDMNFPVMTTPDGRKYKMLVAPLILDLDGRLNVNVHGNIIKNGQVARHAGNQGWGPWEVNLGSVLNADNREWQALFLGTNGSAGAPPVANQPRLIPGRYGNTHRPGDGTRDVPGGGPLQWYGQVDFNGVNDPGKSGQLVTPTAAMQLARAGAPTATMVPYMAFPYYPAEGYGNASPVETTTNGQPIPPNGSGVPNHPSLFNPFYPAKGNRVFPVKDMVPLLRWNGTGSEFLSSDLLRLLPNNLQNMQRRNLLTTLSMDLDRPGSVPSLFDRSKVKYELQSTPGSFPRAITPQDLSHLPPPLDIRQQRPNAPASSDYDPNWRPVLSRLSRVDVNRITPFPLPGANGLLDINDVKFLKALYERQYLAADLFAVLREVTGTPPPGGNGLAPAQIDAQRWLAQLAVNIVDFIDTDDYATPFVWNPRDPNNPLFDPPNYTRAELKNRVVFGTELPRLVLNEMYMQYDNEKDDPGITGADKTQWKAQGKYDVNCWVELHNPMISRPGYPTTDGNVILQTNANPIYKVVLAKDTANTLKLRDPGNVDGDPDFGQPVGTNVYKTVADFGDKKLVSASNRAFKWEGKKGSKGFYLLGPEVQYRVTPDPAADPKLKDLTTYESTDMTFKLDSQVAANDTRPRPTIILRRLANPNLPPNPATPDGNADGTKAYNPYITVDFMDATKDEHVTDARIADRNGSKDPPSITTRRTVGRRQIYGGLSSMLTASNLLPGQEETTCPQHTFGRHNSREDSATVSPTTGGQTGPQTLTVPFDWLVHMDRAVISPMELLHVSAFKPHELTQQFVQPDTNPTTNPNGVRFKHMAPWLDETSRLYRALEYFETRSFVDGVRSGGRLPGKVNINAIRDLQLLTAVVDPEQGNSLQDQLNVTRAFGSAEVSTVFGRLATSLNPGNPDPIWGMDIGPSAADNFSTRARGLASTFLRLQAGTGAAPRIQLDPYGPDTSASSYIHPYQRYRLVTKLYNQVTTRSNVFAVYLTVGFFEAHEVQDGNYPGGVKYLLGAEVGRAENRHIRHRMFAIVDRTQMVSIPQIPVSPNVQLQGAPQIDAAVAAAGQTISGTDSRTGKTWTIGEGSVLTFEPGHPDREETVVLRRDAQGNLVATFRKDHVKDNNGNYPPVISRGNPGPWTRYDVRRDPAVVPYYAVID